MPSQQLRQMYPEQEQSGSTDPQLVVEASPEPAPVSILPVVGKLTHLPTAQFTAFSPRNHPSEEVLPMANRDHRTIDPPVCGQATKSTLQSLHEMTRPLSRPRS